MYMVDYSYAYGDVGMYRSIQRFSLLCHHFSAVLLSVWPPQSLPSLLMHDTTQIRVTSGVQRTSNICSTRSFLRKQNRRVNGPQPAYLFILPLFRRFLGQAGLADKAWDPVLQSPPPSTPPPPAEVPVGKGGKDGGKAVGGRKGGKPVAATAGATTHDVEDTPVPILPMKVY